MKRPFMDSVKNRSMRAWWTWRKTTTVLEEQQEMQTREQCVALNEPLRIHQQHFHQRQISQPLCVYSFSLYSGLISLNLSVWFAYKWPNFGLLSPRILWTQRHGIWNQVDILLLSNCSFALQRKLENWVLWCFLIVQLFRIMWCFLTNKQA